MKVHPVELLVDEISRYLREDLLPALMKGLADESLSATTIETYRGYLSEIFPKLETGLEHLQELV